MKSIRVRGGKLHQREIAEKTVKWCIPRIRINDYDFYLSVNISNLNDCYGHCSEGRKKN